MLPRKAAETNDAPQLHDGTSTEAVKNALSKRDRKRQKRKLHRAKNKLERKAKRRLRRDANKATNTQPS